MIAIIDYGMGNIGSVKNALDFLGVASVLSREAKDIENASHIILPGVGAFPDGMNNLKRFGLVPILREEVMRKKKPILGICLGLQLLADRGEEGGACEGLGFVGGTVRKLRVDTKRFRVPHIGWNDCSPKPESVLFQAISSPVFYFVHSYVLEPADANVVSATCDYGETFTASIQKENIFGTQFHPEKSQRTGLALLKNFLDYA